MNNKRKLFGIILIAILVTMILSACTDAVTYTITFDSRGGSDIEPIVYTEGEDAITLPTPTKSGCTFVGWYEEEYFTGDAVGTTYVPTEDVTLYARWSSNGSAIVDPTVPEGIHVRFVCNGGGTLSPIEYVGEAITLPTPSRSGYNFRGWYLDESLSGEAVVSPYTPSGEEVILYAKWEEKLYVRFVCNGGGTISPIEYVGEAITLPVPTRSGFNFRGWYLDENLSGAEVVSPYTLNGEDSVTLYAKWEETPCVRFVTDSDDDFDAIEVVGEPVALPEPYKYGYVFEGWYLDENYEGEKVSSPYTFDGQEVVILYAKYREVSYIYLYYGVDDFDYIKWTKEVGDEIAYADLPVPDSITKNGIECPFVKWTLDYEGNNDITEPIVARGVVCLYAQYDKSSAPVNVNMIDNGDGTYTTTSTGIYRFFEKSDAMSLYSVDMILPKDAEGGAGIAFRMTLGDRDYPYEIGQDYLYAVLNSSKGYLEIGQVTRGSWKLIDKIVLTSLPQNWQNKFAYGDTITLAVAENADGFKIYMDGELVYTCTDFATIAAHSGRGYGARYSLPAGGVKYSDIVYRNTPLKISFDTDGGNDIEDADWIYGTLELPTPVKEGWGFAGWYYDEALTDKVSNKVFFTDTDTTLYAKWVDDFYTISFESNGGSVCNPIVWTEDTVDVEMPVPSYDNHIFLGWYRDRGLTDKFDESNIELISDITLYAGYRYPYATGATKNADGVWVTSSSTTSAGKGQSSLIVDGILNEREFEISADITFIKGNSSSVGIMFYGSVNSDYGWEGSGESYMAAQIKATDGSLSISSVTKGSYKGLASAALGKLPSDWRSKYNNAASGSSVSVTLKIVCDGSSFDAYIDGNLAYEYNHSDVLNQFTGMAYGARANSAGATIKFAVKQNYRVEFFDGETDLGSETCDGIVAKVLEDTEVKTDADGAYLMRFSHWADADGNRVETVSSNATLYAVRERVDLHTVTYKLDNGEEDIVRYYEDGQTLVLPTDPFKNGTVSVDGTVTGYAFIGWYIGENKVVSATVNSDMTLVAKYEESVAYTVSYVTGVDDITVEDQVVTAGTPLSLPTVDRGGYRLLGWYYDETKTDRYQEGTDVNANLTLYASWVQLIEVTFVADGVPVKTETIDVDSSLILPDIPSKGTETLANGNVATYTADGWYVGDVKIDALYVFDKDTEVVARYLSSETRSVFTVIKNDNGYDGYSISGSVNPTKGTYIPDVTLDKGEFSFTVTCNKPSDTFELRIAFYLDDKGYVAYTGGKNEGNQSSVWVTQNFKTGGLIFGKKVEGVSGNTYGLEYPAIKSCAYKTYFDSVAAGSEISLTMKVVFCNAAIKYYVNDCLLFTYGDADYSGETLYGVHFDETNYSNGQADQKKLLDSYLAAPTGKGVGFQFIKDTKNVGGFTISDVTVKECVAIKRDDGDGNLSTIVKPKGTIWNQIASKDTVVDGNTMTTYTFEGWYSGEIELGKSFLVDDLDGKTIKAKYSENTVDCFTISFESNGGSSCDSIGWTSDTTDLTLPTPTYDSHIFLGWYYDEELNDKVDASAIELASDVTLYAGWRLPTANGATRSDDGKWVTSSTKTNSLIVEGILESRSFTITADITIIKGNSSSIGIMFYGSVNADNDWETHSEYISVQIKSADGTLPMAYVKNKTYKGLPLTDGDGNTLSTGVTLDQAPEAWKSKYESAAVGDEIDVTLKVVCDGSSFSVYIDDDLVGTCSDSALIEKFSGMAYGARANSAGATIKFGVTYNDNSSEEE